MTGKNKCSKELINIISIIWIIHINNYQISIARFVIVMMMAMAMKV